MATGSISYDKFRSLIQRFVDVSNKIDDKWHLECEADTVYMSKICTHLVGCTSALSEYSESVPSPQYSCDDRSHPPAPGAVAGQPVASLLSCTSESSEPKSKYHCPTKLAVPKPYSNGAVWDGHEEQEEFENTADMEMEALSEDDDDCRMPTSDAVQQQPLTYEYHIVYNHSYCVPVLYFNVFTPDGKLQPLEEIWKSCPSVYQKYLKENKWATLTQQEHPVLGRPFFQLHPCHTADLMAQVTAGSEKDVAEINYLVTWLSTVGPLVGLNISPAYITKP